MWSLVSYVYKPWAPRAPVQRFTHTISFCIAALKRSTINSMVKREHALLGNYVPNLNNAFYVK